MCGNGEPEFGEACDDGNTHELDSCTIGACEPAPDHLMTFDAQDGSVLWSDDIGSSWSHVAVANGVVFAGTNGAAELYAYDAVTGARLATLGQPTATASRAAVDGRSLYIGYGLGGPGGIRAFILPWQRLRLAVEPGAVERSYSEPMGAVLAGEMT